MGSVLPVVQYSMASLPREVPVPAAGSWVKLRNLAATLVDGQLQVAVPSPSHLCTLLYCCFTYHGQHRCLPGHGCCVLAAFRCGHTRVAAAAQGLMLKSSKWAPYEPPQEMLRALEERCAGPDVAGGPPACPVVPVMLSTNAPGRSLAMAEACLLSQTAVSRAHCLACGCLNKSYIRCRVGSHRGWTVDMDLAD